MNPTLALRDRILDLMLGFAGGPLEPDLVRFLAQKVTLLLPVCPGRDLKAALAEVHQALALRGGQIITRELALERANNLAAAAGCYGFPD